MRDDPGWPAVAGHAPGAVDPVQLQPELPFRASDPDDPDARPRLGRFFTTAQADEPAPGHFPGVPRLDNLLPAAARPRPRPRIVLPRVRAGRPVPRPRAQ